MEFWVTVAATTALAMLGTWRGYRVGLRMGRLEGFADGLVAHKEVQSQREQRQRDEYTDYLRQQEQRDEDRRAAG